MFTHSSSSNSIKPNDYNSYSQNMLFLSKTTRANNLSPAPRTGRLARNIRVRRHRSTRHGLSHFLFICRNRLARALQLLGLGVLGSRGVPVPQHLQEEDCVEGEAGNVSVENERVRDFLQRGEDARERAEEVVYDLVFFKGGFSQLVFPCVENHVLRK